MDDAISIRSARASDYAELSRLFDQLDRLHVEGAPWLLQQPARDPRPPMHLDALLADSDSAVLVADVGECVGLATVRLRDAPSFPVFIPQQHAVVDDFIIQANWRRTGIGRRLFGACEAWARERDASWLEVNVYDFNAAASDFYVALGFETTMRRMRKPLREPK
jgi:GNAT superfamily N-acetyltransferase